MTKRKNWSSDADVLAEGRKYASRKDFSRANGSAYNAARKRDLLKQLYPSKVADWSSDADVLAEGRKYASRGAFMRGSCGAYDVARRRNLLDLLYPSQYRRWSDDEDVLAEARKYASRGEFQQADGGVYQLARRRKLLDLINWPEENARTDNDAIYIWRAVGQHHNGNPVYKIGVTSARLGTVRIEHVARKSGFEFDLICCEPVQCKATELERKLHLLGEDPKLAGFNGCTEFRTLSDSALYAAVSMIACEVAQ